jgi:hypothetical protein
MISHKYYCQKRSLLMKKAFLITLLALVASVALISAPMDADAFLFKKHSSAGVTSSGPQFTPTWNYTIDAGQRPVTNQPRGSSGAWYPSSPGVAGPGYSSGVGVGWGGAYSAPGGGSAAGYFSGNYR